MEKGPWQNTVVFCDWCRIQGGEVAVSIWLKFTQDQPSRYPLMVSRWMEIRKTHLFHRHASIQIFETSEIHKKKTISGSWPGTTRGFYMVLTWCLAAFIKLLRSWTSRWWSHAGEGWCGQCQGGREEKQLWRKTAIPMVQKRRMLPPIQLLLFREFRKFKKNK